MFDPFEDFDRAGYLRNRYQEKDARIIKRVEHESFTLHLPEAIDFLARCDTITYAHFLAVHKTLFTDLYPWAGQDRSKLLPNLAISKAGIFFCHPRDVRRAVEDGLRQGAQPALMAAHPGQIMGLFAYGHPFLDGNGRTMLLVHLELCYRAGFSIDWSRTDKTDYLNALTREIETPGHGILDAYLLPFKGEQFAREHWGSRMLSLKGLDGLDEGQELAGDVTDPDVAARYRAFETKRNYAYDTQAICGRCNMAPCRCNIGHQ